MDDESVSWPGLWWGTTNDVHICHKALRIYHATIDKWKHGLNGKAINEDIQNIFTFFVLQLIILSSIHVLN